MKRTELLAETREGLARTGFYLSRPSGERGLSFDFVARRDDVLLIVKVFQNVDALTRETASELKVIARTLKGSPLVVGERSGTGPLEDGVVYGRFDVPIITRRTLLEYLEDAAPPFLYAAPGGLYVRLDTDLLRRLREERQISLGRLADVAGVSRRTIQMYLEGMSATADAALRLEEFLGEPIAKPMDPFALVEEALEREAADLFARIRGFERELFERLRRMGYDVLPTIRSPFDAFTRHAATTHLAGVSDTDRGLDRKAELVANIGRVVEKDSVLFTERRSIRMSVRGVPVIAREEVRRVRDLDDLEEMISERKG